MFVTAKTRRQSLINSLVMFVLLLVLLGLLAWFSNRHSVEFDWTATGRHTLSEASRNLLAQMPDPIEVTSYARENPPLRDAIRKFVGRYQRHKQDINLHFVNPDAVPDEVRSLGVQVDGEIIIRYRERTEHVRTDEEQVFTNALQRLARSEENWLAFVEGHGERKPLGNANFDLGAWIGQLNNQGFRVQPFNLSEVRAVPDNTRILAIAGPRIDYLPGEVDMILDYVRRGGNLLWLYDPGPMHGLERLAEALGIRFSDGAVIDYAGQLIGINDPSIALVTSSLYGAHPVTNGFEYTTLFPLAGAIEMADSDQWTATALLTTGDHTWVETGKLEGEVEYNDGADRLGPLNLAVALEREVSVSEGDELVTREQRILVVADGDFVSNTYLANSGNNELGTRMLNWLSNDDNFIVIPPKIASDAQLEMSGMLLGSLGIFFLFVLPIGLVVTGITVGLRRKKQ